MADLAERARATAAALGIDLDSSQESEELIPEPHYRTARGDDRMMQYFQDFLRVSGAPEEDGHLPSPTLIKEYAEHCAASTIGRLSVNRRPQLSTVLATVQRTMQLLEVQHGSYYDLDDLEQVTLYIRQDLGEWLEDASREKPIANGEDLLSMVKMLFSREYLCRHDHMRQPLNLALFLSLFADCMARGRDLLGERAGDLDDNDHQPEAFLAWKDVRVVIDQQPGEPTSCISIVIQLRNLKGGRPQRPCRLELLPSTFAGADSALLLLLVADLDGVFTLSIDEILSHRPNEFGSTLTAREEVLELPVFRDVVQANGRWTVGERSMDYFWINRRSKELGRHTGFEQEFSCFCLRRGVMNVAAELGSEEERREVSGHSRESNVFHMAYASRDLVIDAGGDFRRPLQSEEEDLSWMTRMGGNRDPRAALAHALPIKEQVAEIRSRPRFREVVERIDYVTTLMVRRHGTVSEAMKVSSPLYDERVALVQERSDIVKTCNAAITRRLRQAHFAGERPAPAPRTPPAGTRARAVTAQDDSPRSHGILVRPYKRAVNWIPGPGWDQVEGKGLLEWILPAEPVERREQARVLLSFFCRPYGIDRYRAGCAPTADFRCEACGQDMADVPHGHRADHLIQCARPDRSHQSATSSRLCQYCDDWYTQGTAGQHLRQHLGQVRDLVAEVGFEGLRRSGLVKIPAICPFCLAARVRPMQDRLRPWKPQSTVFRKHVLGHIKLPRTKCPVQELGLCTDTTAHGADELKNHLIFEHGISLAGRGPPYEFHNMHQGRLLKPWARGARAASSGDDSDDSGGDGGEGDDGGAGAGAGQAGPSRSARGGGRARPARGR